MLRHAFWLFCVLSASAFGIDFSRYHTQAEINDYLRALARDYPNLVQRTQLGVSDEGREISYITITKGSTQLPALFFNGTHHGDEWSSTESILGLADYLVTHRDDAAVSDLLTHYVFYLEPLVNPDGHYLHTREDVHGADPNRDYAYPETSTAFHTAIISLMKTLIDSRKFRAAAAYHSGIEEVLWPWCYTGAPTSQQDLLYTVAKRTAGAMGFDRYLQSYDDYATDGEFIDYTFMTQGTIALTFEVSNDKTPPESELADVVNRSIDGAMAFAQAIRGYDRGDLRLDSHPHFSRLMMRNPLWDWLGEKLE